MSYRCNEVGHFARECPTATPPIQPPSHHHQHGQSRPSATTETARSPDTHCSPSPTRGHAQATPRSLRTSRPTASACLTVVYAGADGFSCGGDLNPGSSKPTPFSTPSSPLPGEASETDVLEITVRSLSNKSRISGIQQISHRCGTLQVFGACQARKGRPSRALES